MRASAAKDRAGLHRIALMCICMLLIGAAKVVADDTGGEDQPLKISSSAVGGMRSDTAANPTTSLGNPLDVQRVLMALAIVLGTIFFLRWIGQRLVLKNGGLRGNKAIHVVSRSVISPKQQVIMLR